MTDSKDKPPDLENSASPNMSPQRPRQKDASRKGEKVNGVTHSSPELNRKHDEGRDSPQIRKLDSSSRNHSNRDSPDSARKDKDKSHHKDHDDGDNTKDTKEGKEGKRERSGSVKHDLSSSTRHSEKVFSKTPEQPRRLNQSTPNSSKPMVKSKSSEELAAPKIEKPDHSPRVPKADKKKLDQDDKLESSQKLQKRDPVDKKKDPTHFITKPAPTTVAEKTSIPLPTSVSAIEDSKRVQEVHKGLVKEKKGLADFERIRLLGKGGVGRVYCVRLKGTDQLYAMKVLNKEDMIASKKVHRVLTEREVLATADHPFVATLYYSFQSKSQLCFIMQYCAGGEFYRWILRQPGHRLCEEHAKFYCVEVLLGLEYLHKMGFIYRDLKPENILMHASGHIMLTDFDLSKHAAAPVKPRLVTKMYSGVSGVVAEPDLVTNSFVGTEEYLAPEVLEGTGHSGTVDWWTLGILIFEMLFGTTPFRGKDRNETFQNIKKNSLQFPSNVSVSKNCKKLLIALLHPNPKKRLGGVGGATDVKDHPFFKDVKWQCVRQQEPPIIPNLKGPVDFTYFSGNGEDDYKWDTDEIDVTKLANEDPFKNFEHIDKTEKDEARRAEELERIESQKAEKGKIN